MSSPSVDLIVTTTTEACALSRTWRHISLSWVVVPGLSTPAKSLTQSVGLREESGSATANGADASDTHAMTTRTKASRCRESRIAEDCTGGNTARRQRQVPRTASPVEQVSV